MLQIEVCEECRIPSYISSEHAWLDNGVIAAKRDAKQRLVFFECGNLDPLFAGISEIIGLPIQRFVVDASRRNTLVYMDSIIPDDIKDSLRNGEIGVEVMTDATFTIWKAMGYGKLTLVDVRYEDSKDDFITVHAANPYCIPLCLGNFAGSIEALIRREPGIEYREIAPDVYEVTITEAENPPELKKRLRWAGYDQVYGKGDLDFERCPSCGAPTVLAKFAWDVEGGTIRDMSTGRRMVMTAPSMLGPVFEDLEEELGAFIPRISVEAQKRFAKSGFFSVEEVANEESMREEIALRGMGSLRELKMGRRGVLCKVDNAALPLICVGLTQGLFEAAFDVESVVEWELHADASLEIEVTPKTR